MRVFKHTTGIAVGSAGLATINNDTNIKLIGELAGLYVKYNDSPPATTDVIISTKGTSPSPPPFTILTLTNKNASGWFYPQEQVHDNLGVAIAGIYTGFLLYDYVNVHINHADPGDYLEVWFMLK